MLERFDDFLGAKGAVIEGFMHVFAVLGNGGGVEERVADVIEKRPGVAVGGKNGDVLFGNIAELGGAIAGRSGNRGRDLDEVAKDQRHFFVALFEHDGFGLERIVDSGAEAFVEIAGHAETDWRCDVDLGHADFQRGIVLGRGSVADQGKCKEKGQ